MTELLDRIVAAISREDADALMTSGMLTLAGRDALHRALSRAMDAESEGQAALALGDRRTLQGEIEAGVLTLRVYLCTDCGARVTDQTVRVDATPPRCFECNGLHPTEQSLLDGRPMVPVDLPVRKLPDAFKHLDSTRRQGIDRKYVQGLVRDLLDKRIATVPLRDVGGFTHNARIVLRFAAERAKLDLEKGAFDEHEALVRYRVDKTEGASDFWTTDDE